MERYFKRKNLALAALLLLGLLPIALGRVPELPSSNPAGALSPVMDVRLYLRHNHFAIFFSVITLFVGGVILCCGGYLGRTVRTYHRKWRQAGLLLGGMLPFIFTALTMESVSKAAYSMIEEVRRQFRALPGIMAGTDKPDYKSCVSISTTAALKEMLIPGLMAVIAPLLVGLLLGVEALGGMIAGSLVTGVLLAIFMSNAGGAWDNAKKYIEEGNHGGKGSEPHKAAVVGDTVGDPFKDTSGPSINILIKLMTVVSLVFAPLFNKFGALL